MPFVIKQRCPEDHTCPCVRICPVGAVNQKDYETPEIDGKKCVECGACSDFCPYHAITEFSKERNDRSAPLS